MTNDDILTITESITNKIIIAKELLSLVIKQVNEAMDGIMLILESLLEDLEDIFAEARKAQLNN